MQDGLITAKLEFFVCTAAITKSYLQMFQSDVPLLPFVTSEIQGLLKTLKGKFVKMKELQAADSPLKITKLDVLEMANHVAASEIHVGFAAADTLAKALKEEMLSQLQAFEFRKECGILLATIVAKIQEMSSLEYHFARKLLSLDPRMIVSKPENATKVFQQVIKRLTEERWTAIHQGYSVLA